ncbi:MAG: cyclic nucleotide-binding domain-containing protein, partial [Arachidicoccus sp.]|nr:cyclic nucleotide-binding domain-containing protein [Arachidicoccus sp.]
MENFLNGLSAYGTLSKEDADCLYHFFERKSFKKNTVLLTEGTISREAFFIVKGSLRQYFHNDKGIERTCNFAFENEFTTDLESFSRKTRSTTNIICMEPAECLVITCDNLVRS